MAFMATNMATLSGIMRSLTAELRARSCEPLTADAEDAALALIAELHAALQHAACRAPPLSALPADMLTHIVSLLPVEDCVTCLLLCRSLVPAVEAGLQLRSAQPLRQPPAGWDGSRVSWLVWRERQHRANPQVLVVAAGTAHSAFVGADGVLCTCGSEEHRSRVTGLLGHGPGVTRLDRPTRVAAPERFARVVACDTFSLALTDGGGVYAWGYGSEGQLGLGDEDDRPTPTRIEALEGERVSAVAVGDDHALAVTERGALLTWGYGVDGRLGHGDGEARLLPCIVEAFVGAVRVAAVAAGRWHSLAVCERGGLYSWGNGGFGRLGHGDEESLHVPARVAALRHTVVTSVAAGTNHTLAVASGGALYSWGLGARGQLGLPSATWGEEPSMEEELTVSLGIGVPEAPRPLEEQEPRSPGGRADDGGRQVCLPTRVESGGATAREYRAVAAGAHSSFAITQDGALFSWGACDAGQLGQGPTHHGGPYTHNDGAVQRLPARVTVLTDVRVVAVSAGSRHTLAVTDGGAVYGWGFASPDDPRLGLGATESSSSPRRLEGLSVPCAVEGR